MEFQRTNRNKEVEIVFVYTSMSGLSIFFRVIKISCKRDFEKFYLCSPSE